MSVDLSVCKHLFCGYLCGLGSKTPPYELCATMLDWKQCGHFDLTTDAGKEKFLNEGAVQSLAKNQ